MLGDRAQLVKLIILIYPIVKTYRAPIASDFRPISFPAALAHRAKSAGMDRVIAHVRGTRKRAP